MTGTMALPLQYEQILAGLVADDLEQQLELRFQPVLALHGSHGFSVEALLRWCHPCLGWVQPDQFIPIAEQHMLMRRLTLWVIAKSFGCLTRWRNASVNVKLSLNISAHDLQSDYLFDALHSAIVRFAVRPQTVTLEVTESLPLGCHVQAAARVRALHQLGFNVALDDFGSGYANMQQLADLPINRVKLDKSLIHSLADSIKHQHVLRSVVRMAHELGIDVVAEGVESSQEVSVLRACGCDYMQGYFIATPLQTEEVQPWYQVYRAQAAQSSAETKKAPIIGAFGSLNPID